jgi:hypothetical protein
VPINKETAKKTAHTERNLVEEYRQKLRNKLNETTHLHQQQQANINRPDLQYKQVKSNNQQSSQR